MSHISTCCFFLASNMSSKTFQIECLFNVINWVCLELRCIPAKWHFMGKTIMIIHWNWGCPHIFLVKLRYYSIEKNMMISLGYESPIAQWYPNHPLGNPQDELAELREWLAAPEGAKDEHRRIAGLRCLIPWRLPSGRIGSQQKYIYIYIIIYIYSYIYIYIYILWYTRIRKKHILCYILCYIIILWWFKFQALDCSWVHLWRDHQVRKRVLPAPAWPWETSRKTQPWIIQSRLGIMITLW